MARLPIKTPAVKSAPKPIKREPKGRVVDPDLNNQIKNLNKLPRRT